MILSIETINAKLGYRLTHQHGVDKAGEKTKEIKELLQESELTGITEFRMEMILRKIDRILGNRGIESIVNQDAYVNAYWQNTIAVYSNAGNSYVPTVLYDTAKKNLIITSYGDWIQYCESSGRYTFD